MVKEKILAKLLKLRNLAEKNNSAEEAANAAAKFQEILFEHNLTENDVKEIETAPVYEKEYYDIKIKTAKWRNQLFSTIASNNFCKVILTASSRLILIGTEENRFVVKFIYENLAEDLNRICKSGVKVAKKENPFLDGAFWNKSFYFGAVVTIAERLKAQKNASINKANEDNGKGTALALKIDNALRDATQALVGATKKGRSSKVRIDGNGYAVGVQAGNSVNLQKSVPIKRIALS